MSDSDSTTTTESIKSLIDLIATPNKFLYEHFVEVKVSKNYEKYFHWNHCFLFSLDAFHSSRLQLRNE